MDRKRYIIRNKILVGLSLFALLDFLREKKNKNLGFNFYLFFFFFFLFSRYFQFSMESKRGNSGQSWRIGRVIMRSRLFRGVVAFTVLGIFYLSLFVSHQHVNVFSIVGGLAGLISTVNLSPWICRSFCTCHSKISCIHSFSFAGNCDHGICAPRIQSIFHIVLASYVRSWCGITLRACASLQFLYLWQFCLL